MTRRYLCDDRRMVLPELTKNGRALTRGVHQRMQECEAALFEAALFKDTSDEAMTVFLPVTLRATGQFVNAVQVSPVKHPSEGTVQSGRIFAGSPGQSASGGPGALTACEEGRGGMGTQCASGLAQPRSPAGRSRASGRPGSESISETGPGGHICPLSAMASVGPFSSLQPAPAPARAAKHCWPYRKRHMTHAHPTKSRFTLWTAAAPLAVTGVLRALPQGTLAVPDWLTGLTALDHDTVSLTRSHPDEAKVDHYRVLRRTKDQRWQRRIGTTQTTSFQDDGLQPETMYIYRVAAVDSDGARGLPTSPPSSQPRKSACPIPASDNCSTKAESQGACKAPRDRLIPSPVEILPRQPRTPGTSH